MTEPVVTNAAPPRAPSYLVIDGTLVGDAVRFGWLLEREGKLVNVLDWLPAAPGDKGRVDPGPDHHYLPIHRLELVKIANPKAGEPGQPATIDNVLPTDDRRRGVAVVCPGGLNGFGKDGFWREYREGEDEDGQVAKVTWEDGTTYGRHTAFERSVRLTQRLLLSPGVEVEQEPDGRLGPGQLLTSRIGKTLFGFTRRASIVFVSSHGYLGGFMEPDPIAPWDQARPATVPGSAKGASKRTYPMASMFAVGKVARSDAAFEGPLWLVFAACSVVNEATWTSWVRVFERSAPQVRGVLAYEEVAPDAGVANKISETFFERLAAGDSLLAAWRTANETHKVQQDPQRWAAIVHDDARGDTLASLAAPGVLRPERTSRTSGLYRGYHSPSPRLRPTDPEPDPGIATEGRPVRDLPPALDLLVEHDYERSPWSDEPLNEKERGWHEIGPEDLDEPFAFFTSGEGVRLTVAPSATDLGSGVGISSVTLEMIHIRPTKPRVPWSSMFLPEDAAHPIVDPALAVTRIDDAKALLAVTASAGAKPARLVLSLRARKYIQHPDVKTGHSYFWLRAVLVGSDGAERKHDFMTQGLLY